MVVNLWKRLWERGTAAARAIRAVAGPLRRPEPFAYVIDDDAGICDFVVTILATLGIKSLAFHNAKEAIAHLQHRAPSVIFLDVALLQSDAIDVVHGLGRNGYGGIVHLMSGGNPSLVEAVQRIGARQGVRFGPPLPKPVRREAIIAAIEGLARQSARSDGPLRGPAARAPDPPPPPAARRAPPAPRDPGLPPAICRKA